MELNWTYQTERSRKGSFFREPPLIFNNIAIIGDGSGLLHIVDLETGDSLDRLSFENPQRFGGSDVMHRISYDGGPHRGELQKAIVTAINRAVRNLSRTRKFP